MLDHFKKQLEAVPCIKTIADETCDHLFNSWIASHVISQSCDYLFNGTAFAGKLPNS